jgi:hypothetical protein
MKKIPMLLAIVLLWLSDNLYGQCGIQVDKLDSKTFICPSFDVLTEQVASFCQDTASDYHFIFASLPSENYYSIVTNNDSFELESERGSVKLTRQSQLKINTMLDKIELGQKFSQRCGNEVRTGGQQLEFIAFKVAGKLQLVYYSASKNSDQVRFSNNKEIEPLHDLLIFLDEIKNRQKK